MCTGPRNQAANASSASATTTGEVIDVGILIISSELKVLPFKAIIGYYRVSNLTLPASQRTTTVNQYLDGPIRREWVHNNKLINNNFSHIFNKN
jgi:hypothetical protein